ncbi:MAG: hypothetical protein KAG64_05750 [Bacteroidales bacterium]|nr:hypothetical protein [Bacteroidales bacterium]
MKHLFTTTLLLFFAISFSYAQVTTNAEQYSRKGELYMYWGWNRGWFTNSDISFKGDNYDFTLYDVVANDRQSPFGYDPYFKIDRITIPQYNWRVGYFFHNNYTISLGVDHMKYVMVEYQTTKIDGYIDGTETKYDKTYNNEDIVLANDLIYLEHTDGLNYINLEVRRYDELYRFKNISLNLTEGFGGGMLMPKTNAMLLNNPRNDEFHVAGFGLGAVVGLNITFWKYVFIQSEFKAGYINMPDIRTTPDASDKASQSFFYTQLNVLFGAKINLSEL